MSAPVVGLRVTVRVPDLEAFIQRYSRHIVGDRIFIFSKSQQPIGTVVRFHLQLADGEPLLSGHGTVMRVQPEGGDARHPPGMELKFEPLDERSRTLVDFMLATRAGMTADVVAAAPPIVRAVVPPRPPSLPVRTPPTAGARPPLSPLAKPPISPTAAASATPPAAPEAVASPAAAFTAAEATSVDAMPPATPAGTAPDALSALANALGPAESAPHATAGADAAAAAKPTPMVRPPSVSLEVGWKEEASEVPANPFAEVSAGAIEYFVEWSFEQSIGPRAMPQAQFSDVPMALPDKGAHPLLDRSARRTVMLLGGALFAAGALVGGVTIGLMKRAPRDGNAAAAAATNSPPPATGMAATAAAKPAPPAPPARDAELIIRTRPPGATVTIDGEAAGATPLTTSVTAGEHTIAVAKERYAPATSTVEAPGKLDVDLHRPHAVLHVTSTPPGADVVIAGERRGRTPLDIKLPGFESYDVRVVLAGARPWRKSVYLGHAANRLDAPLVIPKRR